jgi:hypothetical protein
MLLFIIGSLHKKEKNQESVLFTDVPQEPRTMPDTEQALSQYWWVVIPSSKLLIDNLHQQADIDIQPNFPQFQWREKNLSNTNHS